MHPPRFAHPNYFPHQNQWRPHGPRFSMGWQMQHKNNQNNFHDNESHWCETCDRGFRTLDILLTHKQQHQKCKIDGCQFVAHPKVIIKHIQMQHSTGLYKKIAKLDNPEEIQKWREERKKRYPTKDNIEKRYAEIKEKIDRGEKMGLRHNRHNRENKPHGRREQGQKRKCTYDNNKKNFKRKFQQDKSTIVVNNKTSNNNNKKCIQPPQKKKKVLPQTDDLKTLKPFTGILNLVDDVNDENVKEDTEICVSIEDDEYILMDDTDNKNNAVVSEPVVCGALSSLMCNYESSDEEPVHKTIQPQHTKSDVLNKQDTVEQISSVESSKCLKTKIINKTEVQKSDDDSGPEEAKIVKAVNTESTTVRPIICEKKSSNLKSPKKIERRERQEKTKINNARNSSRTLKSKLPSTLLEKLLRNEIRQERNIVLQCIRYIVKNNYFEKS